MRCCNRVTEDQQPAVSARRPIHSQSRPQATRWASFAIRIQQPLAPWRATPAFHGARLGMTVLQRFLRLAAGRFADMQRPELNDLLLCALAPCAGELMRKLEEIEACSMGTNTHVPWEQIHRCGIGGGACNLRSGNAELRATQ